MIKEWSISNFKALPASKQVPLYLKPLNILVGPNSSGKSTLIQSILLIAQTLNNSSGERPLILNGELVKLGHASDVLHHGDKDQPLRLHFELETNSLSENVTKKGERNLEKIEVNAEFVLPKKGNLGFDISRAELDRKSGSGILVQKLTHEQVISDANLHPNWHMDPVLKHQISKGIFNYVILRQPRSMLLSDRPLTVAEGYAPQISLFHFLPGASLELYDRRAEFLANTLHQLADAVYREDATMLQAGLADISLKTDRDGPALIELIKRAIDNQISAYEKSQNRNYYTNRAGGSSASFQALKSLGLDLRVVENLGDWSKIVYQKLNRPSRQRLSANLRQIAADTDVRAILKERAQQAKNVIGLRLKPLPSEITVATQEINDFFTRRLRYLGPLRDDPRAIYGIPFNPETKDVGVKGEFTAAVLERYKEEIITCPLPPGKAEHLSETQPRKLIDAISEWLQYLDLVQEVTTHDRGKIGYELMVRSAGVDKELDLTNVGVGVSQVLPTLVMALLAPTDSLLLFEQPELHLHPKVQSRLGDFLLGISMSGKQCIVETHSEYLVNRIRRRIAEAEGTTLLACTSIFFVERDKEGAKFSEVIPNEYGAILSWPKGFFDEGPVEAELIMQAAMKKRREQRRKQEEK